MMIRPLSYLLVFLFAAIPCFASDYDTYIQSLENGTEQQRVIARQMLPREGIRAVPDLIKLLHHEDGRTWRAAKNVLSDICHAITLPGYERERGETTDQLMVLFRRDYPLHVEISALRLLAIVTPEGHDLRPIPLYSSIDRNFSKALRSEVIDALVVMNTKSAIDLLASKGFRGSDTEQAEIIDAIRTIHQQNSEFPIMDKGFSVYTIKKNGKRITVDPGATIKLAWMREYAHSGSPEFIKPFKELLSSSQGAEQIQAVDATLQLAENMLAHGGNWDAGIALYQYIIETVDSEIAKGAALAGLGRFGDERFIVDLTSVSTPDLEAPALMGLDYVQGRAAYEALIASYPQASEQMQLGLLGVMGRKKDPIFLDLLLENTRSEDPSRQALAFEALIQSELSGGADAVSEYVESRPADDRKFDIEKLLLYADSIARQNAAPAAGRAYIAIYRTTDNAEFRDIAFQGIKRFPSQQAYEIILEELDINNLSEVSIETLIALNTMLDPAEHPDEIGALRAAMFQAARTTAQVRSILDMAHQQGVGAEFISMMGFLTKWHLAGPFPWSGADAFKKNPVRAPNIDLTRTYKAYEKSISWKQHDTGQIINLLGILGTHENATAYAFASFESDQAAEAQIRVGSDDGVRIWLNGESVHENNINRGMLLDQDILPVRLKKGKNELLVQITQGGGGWGFMLRLTKKDGTPITTGVNK